MVTAVHPTQGRSADLRVNFTIKGITAALPLPAAITELDDGSIQIAGETEVERSRFNLGWNKLDMMAETATVAAETVFVRVPR